MATGNVIVSVVDVGQGQCTFVEIYDTAGTTLLHTLLFDCGSDKQSTETQNNLKWIADKVSSMATPTFDAVFFSHSDKDHIILMWDLLEKFSVPLAIKQVWYGGARVNYTKYGYNILDYLESAKYCPAKEIKSLKSNSTNYDASAKAYGENLWQSDDKSVTVYAIAANVLSDDPDWDDNDVVAPESQAEALNRVSMVCGLYYAGSSYVICGDATNKTMGAIVNLFTAGTTVFDKNVMTTLPHHGSRATGLAVPSAYLASSTAVGVVDNFATLMKSMIMTGSAYEKHHHPSLELMSHFIPTLAAPVLRDPRFKGKNVHSLRTNMDLDLYYPSGIAIWRNFYSTFETQTNTYLTRYCATFSFFYGYNLGSASTKVTDTAGMVSSSTPLNEFACWVFTTGSGGTTTLEGKSNLAAATFTSAPTTTFASAAPIMIGKRPRPPALCPRSFANRLYRPR